MCIHTDIDKCTPINARNKFTPINSHSVTAVGRSLCAVAEEEGLNLLGVVGEA